MARKVPGEWEVAMALRIQRLREAQGLTQAKLAEALGVPIGTVQGWEQARRVPRLQVAVRLARALGVTVEALVEGEEQERSPRRTRRRPAAEDN
jgi:putative transcriptional regulator